MEGLRFVGAPVLFAFPFYLMRRPRPHYRLIVISFLAIGWNLRFGGSTVDVNTESMCVFGGYLSIGNVQLDVHPRRGREH